MQPRNIRPGTTYLITRRCIERRFLLRPSPLTNHIIEYCLAVAAERTGVELHVFCAMSNHVHLVLTDVEGRLPEFLHHFHRNVAVAINASLNRRENLWSVGQTSVVELGDEGDVIEKMAYVVANPTTAGLVDRPKVWPGVITTRLCERKLVRRPKGYFRTEGAMPEQVPLRFVLPQQMRFLGEKNACELFLGEVAKQVRAAQRKYRAEKREFLGPKAVLKQSVSQSACNAEATRGHNPRFAMRDPGRRRRALALWRAFLLAYRAALFKWQNGERSVRFPEGSWMMRRVHRVTCGPPELCTT